jgi:hypothetical protein
MRVRFVKIPLWQFVLVAAFVLAVATALAIVAFGVFLIAVPLLLIAAVAYQLFGRGRSHPAGSHRASQSTVIDVDYRVIDNERHRLDDRSSKHD